MSRTDNAPPTPEQLAAWMASLGAELTSMDEWRISFHFRSVKYPKSGERPYVFFDEQQAAYMYTVMQQTRQSVFKEVLAAGPKDDDSGVTSLPSDQLENIRRKTNYEWRAAIKVLQERIEL